MMYKYQGLSPKALYEPWDGWIAPTATVIGQAELGRQVSIWFGAVVRADNSKIRIGSFQTFKKMLFTYRCRNRTQYWGICDSWSSGNVTWLHHWR